MRFHLAAASAIIVFASSNAAFSAWVSPLYTENFEVDPTADWTTNDGPGVNAVDYFFDYSTVGIPPAPSGTGTRGLKLQANLNPNIANGLTGAPIASSPNGTFAAGGTFGGLTVSPTSKSFGGNYELRFDWWGNYNGPVNGGGNGTTQVSQFGIGTAGTTTQWIGSTGRDAVFFAATLDGGSASDFRAYSTAAPTSYAAGNPVYITPDNPAGAVNNNLGPYPSVFPAGAAAPAAQVGLYPLQTGTTAGGVTAFQWNDVRIRKQDTHVHWIVNGTRLASVDMSTVTFGGGNILFGHSDTNTGASIDETHPELLFTLIDNVRVLIPEPTSLSLSGIALLALLARRKRAC